MERHAYVTRSHPLRRFVMPSIARIFLVLGIALPAFAQQPFITVASTTSTQDSGLFDHLLPVFKAKTGINVRVVALGTGQALALGRRGDADVLLVHDRDAELKFAADGDGVDRREVMYNDFVVIGPKSDPAKIAGGKDVAVALRSIAREKAPFISRGDKSGTHAAEQRYWKEAGIDPTAFRGAWYKEIGQGMGAALNTASASNGYTLSDRGTWLNFRNRGELAILVQGDPKLFNQYGVMLINPARHQSVKKDLGMQFIDWLTSPEGQHTIAQYKINGEQLFFPNYRK
jgi:tungstate transport system substrate-binding protein